MVPSRMESASLTETTLRRPEVTKALMTAAVITPSTAGCWVPFTKMGTATVLMCDGRFPPRPTE